MNIKQLYDILQEETLTEELKGEFNLIGNCIIWSYDLNENSEEIENEIENYDEDYYGFNNPSPEELLQEAYNDDLNKIETYINDSDEYNEWTFSEPEVSDNTISFKIF